ncbi:MAG: GNAT family N-acetyltransferase [Devosia sp.]|nr:GNAT family N-acetyltransferase [Devosia sp.]
MAFDVAQTIPPQTAAEPRQVTGIEVRCSTSEAEWRELMAAAPTGHLPQDYGFAAGKHASGWPSRRLVLSSGGQPVAFAVVLQFHRAGIKLFNRINRGPILLDATPSDEHVLDVFRAIRHSVGRIWTLPLLIAPALPRTERNVALLREAGYIRRHADSWRSGRIDISVSEEQLWKSFSSTFRNRARAAERAAAQLRVADDAASYEWMIARHIENMKAKNFTAAKPSLLRGLREAAPGNVLVFQLLLAGQPVAGMSVVRFGHIAEYHVGWFGPDGRKVNAGNFLMWNVMREMKRRGVRTFDVGGLRTGDGYTQFKRTMKPVEYELAGEWISL